MSHIAQEKRHVLDHAIGQIVNNLRELECDFDNNDMEANVAYVFGSVMKAVYPGIKFGEIVAGIGVLEATKMEFNRGTAERYVKQAEFDHGSL